ncbi:hypothetical protein L6164_011763 [Bauhinia variegata]|uniref:Uncharacterized protein n=1 Tax=Bauhinia variegata TaxID=167791 RepID=A0ACB9P6Z3_BAUVA|nr:hypothetical protein L6164_011763 [Bauhinia variegata]
MEEISPTVAVPFTLGNLIQKESAVATHIEITGLQLMANTAALILSPAMEDCASYSGGSENLADVSPLHQIAVSAREKDKWVGAAPASEMIVKTDRNQILSGTNYQKGKEDEYMIAVDDSCSLSLANNTSNLCGRKSPEIDSPITMGIDDKITLLEPVQNMASVAMDLESEDSIGSDGFHPKAPSILLDVLEKKVCRPSCQDASQLSAGPLWGFSSICGRREEMEDALSAVPQLLQVPSHMLMDDHVNENRKSNLAHFFGVYDGHGGCQVANYCRERLHSALIEEIETAKSSMAAKNEEENLQEHWKKAFSNCFKKVDAEVGGVSAGDDETISDTSEPSREPLAPETVGSTAVVALLSQTHITVANSGDSRAVLYRGKEAIPLSADHKPHREDEWARIEASGGKIIQWNGYRVLGVLAVSRSIGDRYLKPWVIPDPEVKFIRREKNDECLVLASDGLWDVMTNEEACEIARKRILLWHKKYGNDVNVAAQRHDGVDPAAQSAAEYLSNFALQRGSKDNISVIVVDLKAQRKFKRKT